MTEDPPSTDDASASDPATDASSQSDATTGSEWTWGDLFDATSDLDVTEADVRDALRAHREGDDA